MQFLCAVSRSSSLSAAAFVIGVCWLLAISVYFLQVDDGASWGYALISLAKCLYFYRMSRTRLFAAPIFALSSLGLIAQFLFTLAMINYWWSAFFLNRLFDVVLIYVAGCAMFRIRKDLQRQKGAPTARPSVLIEL